MKSQILSGMQEYNVQILSTNHLSSSLVDEAGEKGIAIEIIPFITTESILSIEIQQEIEQLLHEEVTVVFTSSKAVEAVLVHMEETNPNWTIYCVGKHTRELLAEEFGEEKIMGCAESSADLAEIILVTDPPEEIFFFCGDRRRDEMPSLLRQHDIGVTELVVYNTVALPQKINREYHGILFFSPSGVESYFSCNKPGHAILFAIGETTASSIRKFTANHVEIAEEPSKEAIIRKVIDYFT